MIQQAIACFYSSKGRYVKTHINLSPCGIFFETEFLPWRVEDFVGIYAGSSRNKERLRPNAKTLRTAHGYPAEPGRPGIFCVPILDLGTIELRSNDQSFFNLNPIGVTF